MPRLFEHATQYRSWRLSRAELLARRRRANQTAREKSLEVRAEEGSTEESLAVSVDEELLLCQYFIENAGNICKKMKLNDLVRASAIVYFKRFYLDNSVMEYDPKSIILSTTCIFLASKVENSITELHKLASETKTDAKRIKELEFVVSTSINFHFWLRHPFEASWGLFLDVQSLNPDQTEVLARVWKQAGSLIATAALTDLPFLYMPSQIALACWQVACDELNYPLEKLYMTQKFNEPEQKLLVPIMVDIQQEIAKCRRTERELATAVNKKLETCRNPRFDPNSRLYKESISATNSDKEISSDDDD